MINTDRVTFEDITDLRLPDELMAPLDRIVTLPELDKLSEHEKSWVQNGVVYLPKFLPEDLMDAYCAERSKLERPGGWKIPTPYLHVPALKELSLYPPLMAILKDLLGEEAGLHLNLTGWISTERDWHQDTYLNPEFVGTRYAATWMALDDIHEDSGPFQFIPGSHRWPVIRRHLVFNYLTPEEQNDPTWPTFTQDWIARACMKEAEERQAEIYTYVPKKGDVLIWHSNLIHRGSPPNVKGMQRKSLISHYSTITSRQDFAPAVVSDNGRYYFPFYGTRLE